MDQNKRALKVGSKQKTILLMRMSMYVRFSVAILVVVSYEVDKSTQVATMKHCTIKERHLL